MNEPAIDISVDDDGDVNVVLSGPELDTPIRIVLAPDTARDFAFSLTKASYAAEGDNTL